MKHIRILLSFLLLISAGDINAQPGCPHCEELRDGVPSCFAMVRAGRGASGKWLDDVTPKRGWDCPRATDLGKGNFRICEMCEREHVRFLHNMTHPTHHMTLDVGCICAAYMEGRLDRDDIWSVHDTDAYARTKLLRSHAGRAERLVQHARFREGAHGILTYRTRGEYRQLRIEPFETSYRALLDGGLIGVYEGIHEAKEALAARLYPSIIRGE